MRTTVPIYTKYGVELQMIISAPPTQAFDHDGHDRLAGIIWCRLPDGTHLERVDDNVYQNSMTRELYTLTRPNVVEK